MAKTLRGVTMEVAPPNISGEVQISIRAWATEAAIDALVAQYGLKERWIDDATDHTRSGMNAMGYRFYKEGV